MSLNNKRTAVHALLVFLRLNKIKINFSKEELYKIVISVAENKLNNRELSNWLKLYNKGDSKK